MAYAVHERLVPPSGAEHGATLCLSAVDAPDAPASSWQWPAHRGRLVCHAVLARDDCLQLFEVRERGSGDARSTVRRERRTRTLTSSPWCTCGRTSCTAR